MHELPKELSKSLRSWRGSVVRDSTDYDYRDDHLEEGVQADEKRPLSNVPLLPHGRYTRQEAPDNVHRQNWPQSPVSPAQPQSPQHQEPFMNRAGDVQSMGSPTQPRRAATFDKQTEALKRSILDQTKVEDLDGAASRLDDDPNPLTPSEFYELMGFIPADQASAHPKHIAVPNSLFAKIKSEYDALDFRYHMFNILTYFLMTLQLLLSAVFIILGSLGSVDSHIAVAVLGAISTVVAGVLALMKGQGLPNRLRQGRDSLGMVLFEAQELWWDVGAGRKILYKNVRKVREDYLRVMDDYRKNHPDSWNVDPSTNKIGSLTHPSKKAGWASRLTLPLTR
ncbi:hypothetical protein AMS68_007031 [Peltaster fructicola]|uniref:SMODS and SLOG-associating 2TM effector domain-containing protein n=1 Tax=Peltaster fructicola TaxID=286661 RepID=A0A6H0Y3C6_9PEZI|nr:hypothetical protein AMS68_007031 [Peltaster fructicola]